MANTGQRYYFPSTLQIAAQTVPFWEETAGHLFVEENDGTLGLIPSYTHLSLEEQNIDAICL